MHVYTLWGSWQIGYRHYKDLFRPYNAVYHIQQGPYYETFKLKSRLYDFVPACVCVCIMQRVFALSLKVLCSDKLYSLKVPVFRQSALWLKNYYMV